jgi:hypothetical protein
MTLRRKFTIVDALALVASAALGLAWCISYSRFLKVEDARVPPPLPPMYQEEALVTAAESNGAGTIARFPDSPSMRVHLYCRFFSFFLVVWTLTFLFLRMRKPRARLRLLGSYCGTSACVAVLMVLLSETARALSIHGAYAAMRIARPLGPEEWYGTVEYVSGTAGQAVVATWCVLALIRRFRLDRSWIEIFGLVLGAAWIILPRLEDLLTLVAYRA